jgi:hypothetical protein
VRFDRKEKDALVTYSKTRYRDRPSSIYLAYKREAEKRPTHAKAMVDIELSRMVMQQVFTMRDTWRNC